MTETLPVGTNLTVIPIAFSTLADGEKNPVPAVNKDGHAIHWTSGVIGSAAAKCDSRVILRKLSLLRKQYLKYIGIIRTQMFIHWRNQGGSLEP